MFVRRLREGKTYDDFKAAWYPDQGFGVPTRVLNGVRLDDPREIAAHQSGQPVCRRDGVSVESRA